MQFIIHVPRLADLFQLASSPPPTSGLGLWLPFLIGGGAALLIVLVILLARQVQNIIACRRRATLTDEAFDMFFGEAEVGIALLDAEGFIRRTNGTLRTMTGYDVGELEGNPYFELIGKDANPTPSTVVIGALDRFGESRQLTVRRRDGSMFPARFVVAPAPKGVHDADNIIFIEGMGPDKGRGADTGERDRAHGDDDSILANLNHELKTPLTVILGSASMLEMEVQDDHVDLVRAITTGSQRLMGALDTLVYYARIQVNDVHFEPERLDVVEEVRWLADKYRPRAEKIGTKIFVNGPGDGVDNGDDRAVSATVDRSVLRRTVGQILDNAIKFTKNGSVFVQVQADDDSFLVVVSDTGVGISEEHQSRVFDSFFQGSSGSTRRFGGMGLGLPIVRHLVDRLGGTVAFESAAGEGTSVAMRLPRFPAAHPSAHAATIAA